MKLTARQAEVAQLVAEGLSNKLIADQLNISERAVKDRMNKLFIAYQTTSRVTVAVEWVKAHQPCRHQPCAACTTEAHNQRVAEGTV